MSRIALVSLGRGAAMGEVRRVASWRDIFRAAGAEVVEITLDPTRRPHLDGLWPVVSGHAAPERLAWSGPTLRERLMHARPDAVVVVSIRAYDPRSANGPWTLVVDHVDSLSRSYRDRAAVVDGLTSRLAYRALAAAHRRVEQHAPRPPVRRVAAGRADAHSLRAEWVPNMIDAALRPVTGVAPDRDVLFFGTLRYPPNIEALERLELIWRLVLADRPGSTALVAGASPPGRVLQLCERNGWELLGDFAALPAVAARARVAVAPLDRVAGIQNKVLDAACLGLPQVVTTAALEGFGTDLPLTPCTTDAAFAREIVRLLDEPADAARLARDTETRVRTLYSVDAWVPWAQAVLEDRRAED